MEKQMVQRIENKEISEKVKLYTLKNNREEVHLASLKQEDDSYMFYEVKKIMDTGQITLMPITNIFNYLEKNQLEITELFNNELKSNIKDEEDAARIK